MTNRAPSVLSISYDESLLRTRELILKSAGFNVTSALGFTQATAQCRDSSFDLVIAGHSLPWSDKAALVQEVRKHNHTRILGLRRHGEEPAPDLDHSIESFTPHELLRAVRTVLGKSASASAGGND